MGRSSVGRNYARKRGIIFLVLGLIFLGAGIAVTVGFIVCFGVLCVCVYDQKNLHVCG